MFLGNVDGVIVINIVLGFMGLKNNGMVWFNVGKDYRTIYGGVLGNVIRFIVFRAVIVIVREFLGFFILVTGGIDFVEVGL